VGEEAAGKDRVMASRALVGDEDGILGYVDKNVNERDERGG
jgi:hypothetical protein